MATCSPDPITTTHRVGGLPATRWMPIERTPMQSIAQSPGSPHRWLAVSAPEEIEFLVKESEVLTGKPGRTFVNALSIPPFDRNFCTEPNRGDQPLTGHLTLPICFAAESDGSPDRWLRRHHRPGKTEATTMARQGWR